MKVGVLVLCRYNSNRLPGKILKRIKNKSILLYILEKIEFVVPRDQIVVCTSSEETDNPIYSFCLENRYSCYRGSLDNVANRFLECGLSYQFDSIVRINGDNLFLDRFLLENMISEAASSDYDFLTNVWKRTYPKGMSIEMVKTSFYESMLNQHFYNEKHFEHVTIYFYEHFQDLKSVKCFYNSTLPDAAGAQLAIDTQQDFEMAEKIISKFEKPHTEYNFEEIFYLWKEINE